MKLYMAGPLFTSAERAFNANLARLLRALGHEIFLPQECEQRNATSASIFAGDVKGIEWCEMIVACMDGADPDSGTCWECGSVWGRKPVVLYRTDIRSESKPLGPFNLMLHQSAFMALDCQWLTDVGVANVIDDAILTWVRTPDEPVALPGIDVSPIGA